ncbi:hypothetical protein TVNIR_3226 [Thioalkalivibrio nitratireducens DSM 14787]|uniref:Uncharacterized protein n=1 Tax=Thioalkalivibrio nitratireducens (strain DSM 14787 / UNIQEM 213 / ALEN2) TaxID=1255043 RepID=L0E0R2_THIND|nr:hypothetical protein TVNIR_3226 [Thioalkalivibrio nitratireducens DSM 14787]
MPVDPAACAGMRALPLCTHPHLCPSPACGRGDPSTTRRNAFSCAGPMLSVVQQWPIFVHHGTVKVKPFRITMCSHF